MEFVQYKTGSDPVVKVWRAMDKSKHFGIFERDGKFVAVEGGGLPNECSNCPTTHEVNPDEWIGDFDTGFEAATALENHLKQQYESVSWQGTPPRMSRGLKSSRNKFGI